MQPMLPTFHIIGNVTPHADNRAIQLEEINDASGITYYKGIYHVWHQCCQNHFDHVISNDLIHWQRLPPPIQPLGMRTFDGSVSMLDAEDGGPVILYDAPDKIPKGWPGCGECILSLARLKDANDKYLKTFTRDPLGDPVSIDYGGVKPVDFPSTIWRNGDHYNFVAQGAHFTTKDKSFRNWARASPDTFGLDGCHANGGQWWIPTPNQVGGSPPPAGTPNYLVSCSGGDSYKIGNYHPENETFVWSGKMAHLEHAQGSWWGAQGGPANNNRMMMIGWQQPDYRGGTPAGPGINVLTRLTLLREVNWDVKTENLVANPVPELVGLRTKKMASQKIPLDVNTAHVVSNTGGGAAASSDTIIKFSGFGSTATFGACVLGNGQSGHGIGISISVNSASNGGRVASVKSGACQVGSPHEGGGDVQLFDDESELTVRVLADRSVVDWFVQGGRWAGSNGWDPRDPPRKAEDSNVMVWSSASGVNAQVDSYQMGCGWLNPSYTENPTLATIDAEGKAHLEAVGDRVWV